MRKHNRIWIWVAFAALLLAALACGGGEEPTPTVPPPPPPTATTAPTKAPPTVEPQQPAAGAGKLEIVNQTSEAVCYVFIAPSNSEDWGPEQLGEGNVVAAGESFTITDIPPGTYDLKAENCSNEIVARNYEVKLGAIDITWTLSDTGLARLILENQSSVTMCYLYITPDVSDGWGSDQIGEGNTIPAGDTFTITDIPPGTYDLRIVACEDPDLYAEHMDADISTEFTWTISD
jgi:hypothetical protein